MKGRKPVPTALHLLRGNPGRRAHKRQDPKPALLTELTPPSWLHMDAAAEWTRLAPMLARLGVLTETDTDALAAYCEAFTTWKLATVELRARGLVVTGEDGTPRLSPYVKLAETALTQVRAFLVEFGLTPSSRARVQAKTLPAVAPASKWRGLL